MHDTLAAPEHEQKAHTHTHTNPHTHVHTPAGLEVGAKRDPIQHMCSYAYVCIRNAGPCNHAYILQVLYSVSSLLQTANPENALDHFIANIYMTKPLEYQRIAREWTQKYALSGLAVRDVCLYQHVWICVCVYVFRHMFMQMDQGVSF